MLCGCGIIIRMNRVQIGVSVGEVDEFTWGMTYSEANRFLPLLRSDYFREVALKDVAQVHAKELRFLIQLTRLLKNDVRCKPLRDR